MIFYIKHRWWVALSVTLLVAPLAWLSGASPLFSALPLRLAVLWGLAGGALALCINAALHGSFTWLFGEAYTRRFLSHARVVVAGMRWPEFVCGGIMAAAVEEPLFRGLVLPMSSAAFSSAAAGVCVAALAFAACHWLRAEFFPFWCWALWEGVWFGILMVLTDSLIVPVVAHGLHDVIGYAIFRRLVPLSRGSARKLTPG